MEDATHWDLISPHRDRRGQPTHFPSPQIGQSHSIPPYPAYRDTQYSEAPAFHVLRKPQTSPPQAPPYPQPPIYHGNSMRYNTTNHATISTYPLVTPLHSPPFQIPEPHYAPLQPCDHGRMPAPPIKQPGYGWPETRMFPEWPACNTVPQRPMTAPKQEHEPYRSGHGPQSPFVYPRQQENIPVAVRPSQGSTHQSNVSSARSRIPQSGQPPPTNVTPRQVRRTLISPSISSPALSSVASPPPPAYTSPKPSTTHGPAVSNESYRPSRENQTNPSEQVDYSRNAISQEGRRDPRHRPGQNKNKGKQYHPERLDEKAPRSYETICGGLKKALLVGINYTGTKASLQGCINDINRMYTFLIQHGGYLETNIVVLADDGPEDKKPTRERMINYMKDLVQGAEPGDTFFFHFSGHGGEVIDVSGDEESGMDQSIYPVDHLVNGPIIDDDLYEILVKPLPEGCRLTVLVDACHSGTVLDLPYTYSKIAGRNGLVLHVNEKELRNETKSDVVLFSACQDKEQGMDSKFNNLRAGAMTYMFTNALADKPLQTYDELINTIVENLGRISETQHPVLSASHHIDTRQFVLF